MVDFGIHDYHPGLGGYRPEKLSYDGCAECQRRARMSILQQLSKLSPAKFLEAWDRAIQWDADGCPGDVVYRTHSSFGDLYSHTEVPLLAVIWSFQNHGVQRPSMGEPSLEA